MENLRNIIPWGFVLPFIIIIGVEYAISYGLNFYNQRLTGQITNLEIALKQKQEKLAEGLETNEAFKVFSQVVNLIEILKQHHPLSSVIINFNKIIPKFVIIKEFSYNSVGNEIQFIVFTQNWLDYARFIKYINNLKEIRLKSFSSPKLNEQNMVEFSLVISLKPDFFK
jgi:hypothetical protein